MKRLLVVTILAAASVFSLGACNKPSEDSCRKALANMQRLMGTENLRDPGAMEGEVRRCKGGSKKSAVDCAIKAQTFEELKHCNFYHLPDNELPSNLRDGSAAAGSAASGSAAGSAMSGSAATPDTGSAAMGSGAGSAAMGSGAGSAAMGSGAGSAATGSGAGSAMGSAAAGSGASSGSAAGKGASTGSGAKAGTGAAKTGETRAKSDPKKAIDSADPMEGGQ